HFAQRAGKAAIGAVLEIDLAGEPARDGAVIGGRAGIGLGGELLAQFIGNATGLDGLEDLRIVGRVDNDGHICVVLGGGADHGGAANVDIFDDIVIGRAGGDGLFERVEVDRDQINGTDLVLIHGRLVGGVVADREQAAMHL